VDTSAASGRGDTGPPEHWGNDGGDGGDGGAAAATPERARGVVPTGAPPPGSESRQGTAAAVARGDLQQDDGLLGVPGAARGILLHVLAVAGVGGAGGRGDDPPGTAAAAGFAPPAVAPLPPRAVLREFVFRAPHNLVRLAREYSTRSCATPPRRRRSTGRTGEQIVVEIALRDPFTETLGRGQIRV